MKIYAILHSKYNFNLNEIDQLLNIIKQWYCLNDDTNLFTDKTKKLIIKINLHNFRLPQYLYRAYSFKTQSDLDSFLKGSNTKLSHPTKDYESWTSSMKVAESYYPGGQYQLNKENKYGVILKIKQSVFQDKIKFSLENLFGSQNPGFSGNTSNLDKKIFFNAVFQYLSNKLLDTIKNKGPEGLTKQEIQDFQYSIPGLVRAVSEYEYLTEPLDYPQPLVVKITDKKLIPAYQGMWRNKDDKPKKHN